MTTESETVPTVAVTTVVPTAFTVRIPSLSISATDESELLQMSAWSVFSGTTSAVIFNCVPTGTAQSSNSISTSVSVLLICCACAESSFNLIRSTLTLAALLSFSFFCCIEPETMEATVRIMTTPPATPGMTQFFILFFFAISYLSRFVFYFSIPQSCVNEK